jgi:hypothetical protein
MDSNGGSGTLPLAIFGPKKYGYRLGAMPGHDDAMRGGIFE